MLVSDVSGMDGGGIVSNQDGLDDSDDNYPPTNFRLPPDGHEFPEGKIILIWYCLLTSKHDW